MLRALLVAGLTRGAQPLLAGDSPELRLLCWSEYVPADVIASFTQKTGAKVSLETYNSNDQMLAKLRAKPDWYDLTQPSGFYVKTLAEAGALEPLDAARIPGLANLDPAFRHLAFDPDGKWSVPWLGGTVGIVLNTEKVREPIAEWADVFSGKHAGRIVVVDDPREMVAWALASLDLPITDVSEEPLGRAEEVLRRWLPQVAVFDSDSPKEALLKGRAEIGIVWSGEAALLLARDPKKFAFVLPTRGAHRFVDSLAIPRGAPHLALAHEFIDWCLQPEVSARISAAFPYTNPNAAARGLLPPEQLANPASYPPRFAELPMLRNDAGSGDAVNAMIARVKGEIRR